MSGGLSLGYRKGRHRGTWIAKRYSAEHGWLLSSLLSLFFLVFSERIFSRLRSTFTGFGPLCVYYFCYCSDRARASFRYAMTDDDDNIQAEIQYEDNEIFIIVNGVKIAKRGNTLQAETWTSLEPGWRVYESTDPDGIVIEHERPSVQ